MLDIELPIPTVSEANNTDHWSIKSKRKKIQKLLIKSSFNRLSPIIIIPCHVILTRLASRDLDDDNLVSAFKTVRDAIADYIRPGLAPGRADDHKGITWVYKQERAKTRGVRIQIKESINE